MPRKESEAVPEGNSPVPQQEEFGSGEPTTLANVYRLFEERYKKWTAILIDGTGSWTRFRMR